MRVLAERRQSPCSYCREEPYEDDLFVVELAEPECWTLLQALSTEILKYEPGTFPELRSKYVLMYDQVARLVGATEWDRI